MTAQQARLWRLAAGALAAVVVLLYVGATLFTTWRDWDDEGYMLLAIGDFARHGALYERFPTPYGPFFFEFSAAVFRSTGLPFDSTSARIVTGVLWLATTACVGWTAWRATSSAFAACAAGFVAGFVLAVLANEPLHPGGLSVLLLSLLALVLVAHARARAVERANAWRSVACGALVAALVFTKPNVGVLAALAIGVDVMRRVPGPAWNRVARVAAFTVLVLFPFALTRSLQHVAWVPPFAVLAALSLAPFALAAWCAGPPASSWREVAALVTGAAIASVAILGVLFATGTTGTGLFEGFLGEALRFPGAFLLQPRIPGVAWIAGAAALALAAPWLLRAARARHREHHLGVARGVASAVVFVAALSSRQPFAVWPLLWIVALPATSNRRVPALYPLTLLAAAQVLHAYPVAGSQIGFFAFLFPLVGALGAWQAWHELPDSWRTRATPALSSPVVVTIIVVAALAVTPLGRRIPQRWRAWTTGVPIGVSGARGLRLSEGRAARLACVVENLKRGASTFLGVPGVHSFYAWTGLPPPVPFYPPAWILFWDAQRQLPMRDVLAGHPRAWVVRNEIALAMWLHDRPRPGGPLWEWVDERHEPWLHVGDYEILVSRGQDVRPVLVARRNERAGTLELVFAGESAEPVARVVRITIVDTRDGALVGDSQPSDPERALLELVESDAPAPQGRPLQAFDLSADREIRLRMPAGLAQVDPDDLVVRGIDAQGRVVARLVFPR